MKLKIIDNISHKNLKYYFSGSFFLGCTQIFSMILSFIGVYIFTNYSSKELYGSYAYIKSFALLANGFVAPGVVNAVTYSIAKGAEGSLWEGIKVRWKRSWIAMLMLLIIAAYVWQINHNIELACAFLIEMVLFPFIYCTDLFNGYLQGKKEFKLYSLINLTSVFIGSIAVSLAVLFFKSIIIIILWHSFIVSIFNCIVLWYILKKRVKNKRVDGYFFYLSKKWTILSILGTLASQSDRIVIGSFTNLTSLGAFNLAKSIANPLRNVGVIANKLIFPNISEMSWQKAIDWMFKKIIELVILSILIGLISWFIAPVIINIFFNSYKESIWMLRILFLINIALIVNIFLSTLFAAQSTLHQLYFRLNYVSTALQTIIVIVVGIYWETQGIIIALSIFTLISVLFNIGLVIYLKFST